MNVVVDFIEGSYQRGLLSGILEFFSDRSDVTIYAPGIKFANQALPQNVDGMLSAQFGKSLTQRLIRNGVPTINLTSRSCPDTVQVCSDNVALARMAFDHFRACNLNTLAFMDAGTHSPSRQRREAYLDVCEEAGFPVHLLPGSMPFDSRDAGLLPTLSVLPKPVGVLLPTDEFAPMMINSCTELGLRIPNDVQLLGINNNVRMCLACDPPLTSIDIRPEQIGYEGAALLVKLVRGEPVKPVLEMPPGELIPRGTTSSFTQYSTMVNAAINAMHANVSERLEMEDVVRVQELGRRALEKLFLKEVGCSPMQYLRRIRLERIQFLLCTTDLPVNEIGKRCGIPNITYLCRLFQRQHGCTPKQYRDR